MISKHDKSQYCYLFIRTSFGKFPVAIKHRNEKLLQVKLYQIIYLPHYLGMSD